MVTPTAMAGQGRINGLSRTALLRDRRALARSTAHAPLLALGAGLYSVALLFPLVLRQVTEAAYVAAFLGTGLLLLGLHVRWSQGVPR